MCATPGIRCYKKRKDPLNGIVLCNDTGNWYGTVCKYFCRRYYAIHDDELAVTRCSGNNLNPIGIWEPRDAPECIG